MTHDVHPSLLSLLVPIASLDHDPDNARSHGAENLRAIEASYRDHGQRTPIVCQRQGDRVVGRAGNGQLTVARGALGWTHIAAVVVDESDDDAIRFALRDNRSGELARWRTLDVAAAAFTRAELIDLDWESLARDDQPHPTDETDDDMADIKAPPRCSQGDVWRVGPATVVCGSCEDVSTWPETKANLIVTSPPYADRRKYDQSSEFRPVAPDDYPGWWRGVASACASALADDGSLMLNIKAGSRGVDRETYVMRMILDMCDSGWHLAEEFCWEREGMPRDPITRFKCGWEPVYQMTLGAWKFRPKAVMRRTKVRQMDMGQPATPGISATQGTATPNSRPYGRGAGESLAYPSTRIRTPQRTASNGHPAAFPLGLPSFFVRAYTDEGDMVVDPFGGSGTTAVAAVKLGRVAHTIEMSPRYCDIALSQLEDAVGEEASRCR